jgi:hypothetical protein
MFAGGGGGHFFERLSSPLDDGLPGSFTHTFGLLVDAVSCAFETLPRKDDMASASTTIEPRMRVLLLMTRTSNRKYDEKGGATQTAA